MAWRTPDQWAQDAERYQQISDRRRAEERHDRLTAPWEWVVIAFVVASIITALVLAVRA